MVGDHGGRSYVELPLNNPRPLPRPAARPRSRQGKYVLLNLVLRKRDRDLPRLLLLPDLRPQSAAPLGRSRRPSPPCPESPRDRRLRRGGRRRNLRRRRRGVGRGRLDGRNIDFHSVGGLPKVAHQLFPELLQPGIVLDISNLRRSDPRESPGAIRSRRRRRKSRSIFSGSSSFPVRAVVPEKPLVSPSLQNRQGEIAMEKFRLGLPSLSLRSRHAETVGELATMRGAKRGNRSESQGGVGGV